ncbi:MAG: alkaline phosphatase [Armatimonadetes bacterium]|nr:alkaline phosphatase [Armatimonadota bacterium]
MSRRLLLAGSAAGLAGSAAGRPTRGALLAFQNDPFRLGVASGDPDQNSVVLWTRLAPRPLDADGGMDPGDVAVRWEIAEDEGLRRVVRSGTTTAAGSAGHTVHVEARGLRPDRWYWYRFRAGNAESPVGRTRTLPAPEAAVQQLRFAFASCQHFETGLYTAYRQMAADDLDLVCFLGDYIYEGPGSNRGIRRHVGPKLRTVEEYRVRYSQYREDPLLHGMHARCPWFVTWDDHEFENNYAADISERPEVDPAEFLKHRAAAYQAYYEMMPLRRSAIPRGPDMRLYRKASFGRLAEFLVLDTRQYRTDQPNGDRPSDLNEAALNRRNTLLGARQRRWLEESLAGSPATWNILAQQVMMALVDRDPSPERRYSMDQWPSAAAERMALLRFMEENRISNPVVLTGDIHTNWVNDLRVDDRKPEQSVVATEFVGTSISSGGNGTARPNNLDRLLADNPCVRFHNGERGYVRCTVSPESWRSDYVVVEDVLRPGGRVRTRASYVVEAGRPGAKPA